MRRATSLALLSLLLSSSLGCGVFRHVDVKPVATTFHRPSNVAAYVAVTDGDEPLTELQPTNFRVYENDQLIAADQTQLTLLDRNVAAAHHALLLVDMSSALTPEARALVAKAARGFVQKLSPLQAVSVFAFDGAEGIVPIASVPRGASVPSLEGLASYSARDKSRNLNGAIVAALAKLSATLAQSGKVVQVGTLVVFSHGPDVAGRVDPDKAHDAVWESPYDIILVGVAQEAESLEPLARHGLIRAQAANTLPIAFEEAADAARSQLEKYYLVSYCSPARAGTRRLRLEVTYTNKQGEEQRGDFESDFDARGFRGGCNSLSAPRFTLKPKQTPAQSGNVVGAPHEQAPPAAGKAGDDAPVAPPDQSGYAQ